MRPSQVLITDSDLPSGPEPEALLRAAGHDVRVADCTTQADVVAAAGDAEALVVQWAPITAAVLEALPRLRFISRMGIGYDMVDVDAATARGVAVANTPDYCVDEVATHTLALILAAGRGVVALNDAVRAGRWSVAADAPRAIRPSQTTLAIIGFGRIGSRTAAAAAGLGFRVLVHDPLVGAAAIRDAGAVPATLDEALADADILSLHAPLTPVTRHLIDAGAIARMRPGAILVNTCRGGLVDEAALADALHAGHLAGAALDVLQTEPPPADHPLRHAPNVILTPHAAWYSPAALADLPVRAGQQVADFLAGRPVPAIVNPQVVR